MFVIGGFASIAGLATLQYSETIIDPPDTYNSLTFLFPILAVGVVSALAFATAFVALFVWQPGRRLQLTFLVVALVHLLDITRIDPSQVVGLVVGLLIILSMLAAGYRVYRQRIFGRRASTLFLITLIAAQVPTLVAIALPESTDAAIYLGYVIGALYVVCGFAMRAGARTRSRATVSSSNGTPHPQPQLPPASSG
jgi:asparagine N-glycosylation enzyme membrane subunit Stt3